MSAAKHLRLIAENGVGLKGARKAARIARQPISTLSLVALNLEKAKQDSEVVAGLALEFRDLVRALATAMRAGDAILVRALLREAEREAGYVYVRTVNLGDMIARIAPGGAA